MSKTEYDTEANNYGPILPGSDEWPVVRLSKNRKEFVEKVIDDSYTKIKSYRESPEMLKEELELTLFKERARIKENPWKVDPEDETVFWSDIKKQLLDLSGDNDHFSDEKFDKILHEIISRYANEIAGNFKPSHYRLTRSMVTFGFARMLNAAKFKSVGGLFRGKLTLQDKINIVGETEQIRKLAKIGTIVMVPTHFSNIDSITIGFVIHALGLPPFIYGAGLNLFNISIIAYFMNSLGAYKVDRRKKNLIYLETLKSYSNLALQMGIHSLFFPGGTRSRSGKIETRLKLGLLSTAMEAQRINCQKANGTKSKKIFIVPVVLNYNFVLDAVHLISDYLEAKGQERFYTEADKSASSYKILTFLIQFFTREAGMSVSIGKGMDLFGNYVDDDGNSIDMNGDIIDIEEYFKLNGEIVENQQRDSEYTKMLSEKIVEDFHRYARCTASHLAAFCAFEIFRKKYNKLDLYSLLRVPNEDLVIEYKEFEKVFVKLRGVVLDYEKSGRIHAANHMKKDDDEELIRFGVESVGTFHTKRPLMLNKEGNITTKDLKTLYYYRNRLDGYGFEHYI